MPSAHPFRFVSLTFGLLLFGLVILPLNAEDDMAQTSGDSEAEPKLVTSIEGLSEYVLPNGLKVLLFPDASKPVVTVNNTLFVGSRHEGYGEAGMAHLLEHLLFKGTPDHPDVPKALQERGAQFNGTTWVDRTNYYETLPASDDNLEFAIRLEADRMVNSYVSGDDLTSEMTVVRNEFERGENSPSRVLTQKMMAAAYEWHNYGQSTIGNRADIERVPIDRLKAFYKKYYRPDNAMLIIAGKFETETALNLVQKYFGPLENPEEPLPSTYTEEPAQDGERSVTLRRVGEVPLVGLQYHIPAAGHPDYVALDVLESILTMSPTGRLYKALVESKKASSISGVAFSWHDPGILRLVATANKGNDASVILSTMLDTLEVVREDGVEATEVERARTRLLKQVELIQADSKNLALQMSEWAAMGDWRLFFLYRDDLEKVTAEDVQRVAQTYLEQNNRTVGFFIPSEKAQRVSIPPRPSLADRVGSYKGREVVDTGEAFDVSPENIEKRTTRVTLPSGVKAALLPKKTRGNIVNLRLTLRFGNVSSLDGLGKAAEFLGPMLKRGTESLSRQEIQDRQDELRAQISTSSSAGTVTVTIQTKRESLPEVLNLVKSMLREPSFPEAELEILKTATRTSLEKQLVEPTSLAVNFVSRKLNPYRMGDPRYIPTTEEEIALVEAVAPEMLKQLYSAQVGGMNGEVAIVGDFDPETITPLVQDMLADWKPEVEYERITKEPALDVPGMVEQINTPDKENGLYFAGEALAIQDDHPDYPALKIADFIFGSSALSSRLGNRVRQKEGLSYGVASNLQVSSVYERGAFTMYAIANPGNLPKVRSVIREELDKLLGEGISEDELEKAKQGYLQRLEVSRASDATLARTLASQLDTGRSMDFVEERERQINSLTVDGVNRVLKKWLDPERLVIAIAGDLQKGEPDAEETSPSP